MRCCNTFSRPPVRLAILLWVAILFAMTGCALVPGEVEGYHSGWRRGTVLAVGVRNSLFKHADKDCRRSLIDRSDFTDFALIGHSTGGSATLILHQIAPVPANEQSTSVIRLRSTFWIVSKRFALVASNLLNNSLPLQAPLGAVVQVVQTSATTRTAKTKLSRDCDRHIGTRQVLLDRFT